MTKNKSIGDKNTVPLKRPGRKKPLFSLLILGLLLIVAHCYHWMDSVEQVNTIFTSRPSAFRLVVAVTEIGIIICMVFALIFLVVRGTVLSIKFYTFLFVLGAFFYVHSFNGYLAPNGDNAEYLIITKALSERGEAIRLDGPTEYKNTISNVGLPLLMLPIYSFWGFDIIKMKCIIFILALLTGVLLVRLFLIYENRSVAYLIGFTAFVSPYLIGSSSSLMTETPYLFWSLFSLILAHQYSKQDHVHLFWLAAVFLAIIMSYLTRSIGIGLVPAIFLFLLFRYFEQDRLNAIEGAANQERNKLLAFSIPLLAVFVIWQIRLDALGTSHFTSFLKGNFLENISNNGFAILNVWGEMLFSRSTFRWYRMSPDHMLPQGNPMYWIPLIITLWGIIYGLKKKQLLAFYSVAVFGLILMGSTTPQERVIIRYLSILMPCFIYYFFVGCRSIAMTIKPTHTSKRAQMFRSNISYLALLALFLVGMDGNRYNALTKSPTYNSYYDSFLTAAKWCTDNLPSDAIIMSVKPRLVYVLSGKKGIRTGSDRVKYDETWARTMLDRMRDQKVTHIIVDAISLTTKHTIYPLLQNHPQYFEAIPVPGLNEQCTVVKVKHDVFLQNPS